MESLTCLRARRGVAGRFFAESSVGTANVECGLDEKSTFIFREPSGKVLNLNYAKTHRKRFHGHHGGPRRSALWRDDPARCSEFSDQRVPVRSSIHSCAWTDQVGRSAG